MNKKVVLCFASIILIATICLVMGDTNIQQSNTAMAGDNANIDQSNTATAVGNADIDQSNWASGGSGSDIDQSNWANAVGPVVGPVATTSYGIVVNSPASPIRQRVWDNQMGWTLGQTNVCVYDEIPAQIYNPTSQYLVQHEIYPNGQDVKQPLGFYPPGPVKFQFGGDVLGKHLLRAQGSVTGWSPDIVKVQVVSCGGYISGPTVIYGTGGYGTGHIGQSNWASGGWGSDIDQSNTASGSWGSDIDQSNTASGGWESDIDQSNTASGGWESDIDQSNWANAAGNADIDQSNSASAFGGPIGIL